MKPILFLEIILSKIHTIILQRYVKIGEGTNVFFQSHIRRLKKSTVVIGSNCLIGRTSNGYHAGMPFFTTVLADEDGSSVIIGNNCRINGAYIHAKKLIKIGDNCVIASNVNIIDSNGHETVSSDRTVGRDIPEPIIIGNNVWIGLNAVILKGTNIGDNCVIAAGSVVKGTYPKNSVISSGIATVVKELPRL